MARTEKRRKNKQYTTTKCGEKDGDTTKRQSDICKFRVPLLFCVCCERYDIRIGIHYNSNINITHSLSYFISFAGMLCSGVVAVAADFFVFFFSFLSFVLAFIPLLLCINFASVSEAAQEPIIL